MLAQEALAQAVVVQEVQSHPPLAGVLLVALAQVGVGLTACTVAVGSIGYLAAVSWVTVVPGGRQAQETLAQAVVALVRVVQ